MILERVFKLKQAGTNIRTEFSQKGAFIVKEE